MAGYKKYTPALTPQQAVTMFMANEKTTNVSAFFGKALGSKKELGMANLMAVISNTPNLAKCEPMSVAASLVIPTMLGLSISNGDVAVIPYGKSAQVQVQVNGLVQLALRSGEYKILGTTKVYEGETKASVKKRINLPDDFVFTSNTSIDNAYNVKVVGYYAYFKLTNGFEKEVFMSMDELEAHAAKYSKSWNEKTKKFGLADNDKMWSKTVLKRLITKFGPRNLEMQKIVSADDSVYEEAIAAKMVEEKVKMEDVQEMINYIKTNKPSLDTPEKRSNFINKAAGKSIVDWKDLSKQEFEIINQKVRTM